MKKFISLTIFIALGAIVQAETGLKTSPDAKRDKKVFSLFTVVTFPNDQCTTKSSTSMFGTCLAESECTAKSGTVDGNCAAGFGVCCTFTLSACGSNVAENCTYIQNPTYPTAIAASTDCSYNVNPVSSDICQLRLDFDNLDLTEIVTTGGTTAGTCTDSLIMTGPTGYDPADLCGTLTGMHVYIEQGRSTTATILKFSTGTSGGGTWKIKISQIECSSTSRAPADCNQYFTGLAGVAQSYNFPTVQLQQKIFTTCIRRELGYCGVQYSPYGSSSTTPDSFLLDETTALTSNNGLAAADSWLTIPGVATANEYSGVFFCEATGLLCGVDGAVVSSSFSFTHTTVVPPANQVALHTGYKLDYLQVPCSTTP